MSHASNLRTSADQSLAPQRIADFSASQTRPDIHPRYTAPCPVAGKGARPCDLVAAGVCGAGRSRPRLRSALASSEVWFAPDAAPGGSGAVSPVVQRIWRRESDRSGDDAARASPSRRGRGSGKGRTPPLVRGNTSRTAPGKPCTRSVRLSPKRYSQSSSGREPGRSAGPSHSRRLAAGGRRITSSPDNEAQPRPIRGRAGESGPAPRPARPRRSDGPGPDPEPQRGARRPGAG